eukprot:6554162-Lingulodinium_polyedra.AAC.1
MSVWVAVSWSIAIGVWLRWIDGSRHCFGREEVVPLFSSAWAPSRKLLDVVACVAVLMLYANLHYGVICGLSVAAS